MQMNINREITASFCSDNILTASVALFNINFLDTYSASNVYEYFSTVKNFATNSLMTYDLLDARDLYLQNLTKKLVSDKYNQYHTEQTGVFYTPPEFDVNNTVNSMLTMSNQVIYPYNSNFRNFNILLGTELNQYSGSWNVYWDDLTGSVNDHIGDVPIRYLMPIESSPPVGSGNPGDIIVAAGLSYAWSARDSEWSLVLGSKIEDIDVLRRSRADAWLGALKQMIFSMNPFLYAAYYLPLHKIR
jgi:hypothetical protein